MNGPKERNAFSFIRQTIPLQSSKAASHRLPIEEGRERKLFTHGAKLLQHHIDEVIETENCSSASLAVQGKPETYEGSSFIIREGAEGGVERE